MVLMAKMMMRGPDEDRAIIKLNATQTTLTFTRVIYYVKKKSQTLFIVKLFKQI